MSPLLVVLVIGVVLSAVFSFLVFEHYSSKQHAPTGRSATLLRLVALVLGLAALVVVLRGESRRLDVILGVILLLGIGLSGVFASIRRRWGR